MKKRAVTLIEILIVMLLIGIIGGVLAFNMKGSLDKGRIFKTEQSMRLIEDILSMEVACGGNRDTVVASWENLVKNSPLAGRGEELTKDGWGEKFSVYPENTEEIKVFSKRYEEWKQKSAQPN